MLTMAQLLAPMQITTIFILITSQRNKQVFSVLNINFLKDVLMIKNKKIKWMILGLWIAFSVHAATPVSKQYVDALMSILKYQLAQKINGT